MLALPYAEVVFLENVVVDATDPQALGRFWETALGTQTLTDEPDGFETRLAVPGGPVLDLCFQRVPEPPAEPQRLHLDLRGGAEQQQVVERLLGLGASHADIGQGHAPWVVLADPEGNPFCVMEERAAYAHAAGPLAALPLDVADPDREHDFWSWLTGWVPVDGSGLLCLQHSSRRGPLLELCPETEPKGPEKNRMHLDLRLETGDDADAVARGIADRGGRELHPGWGDLPWRVFADPSGNELCLLPSRF
jgi:predicted enzyme related to lactoylglutathione lyase